MMTLSPVDPSMNYGDLEPLICDADSMMDVLYSLITEEFGITPGKGHYVVHERVADRIFFIAGIAHSMSGKVRKAYYTASENRANEGRAAS